MFSDLHVFCLGCVANTGSFERKLCVCESGYKRRNLTSNLSPVRFCYSTLNVIGFLNFLTISRVSKENIKIYIFFLTKSEAGEEKILGYFIDFSVLSPLSFVFKKI